MLEPEIGQLLLEMSEDDRFKDEFPVYYDKINEIVRKELDELEALANKFFTHMGCKHNA